MSLALKKKNGEMPTLFSDWFRPSSIFDSMFSDMGSRLPSRIGVTIPSANIKETDKEYQIELAAPGLRRQDFHVDLNNNLLTIRAEKEDEKEEEEDDYSRKEYVYNSFSRSFQLPSNTVADKIDAKYVDGVLRIHIPKKEISQQKTRKQINVS